SCPRTSRVFPGGAQPYLPSAISLSVPQTPTATASTRTDPLRGSGSAICSSRTERGLPGSTVRAFIGFLAHRHCSRQPRACSRICYYPLQRLRSRGGDMCQDTASRHWLGPAIGMLFLLLMTEPSAAGQGTSPHDAAAATSAAGHGTFAVVTPLA